MWVALFSGLIASVVTSYLTGRTFWQWQLEKSERLNAYKMACYALNAKILDAYDSDFQNAQKEKGFRRVAPLRPETYAKIAEAKSLVSAFFSREAYEEFKTAIDTRIEVIDPKEGNVPLNTEYEAKQIEIIEKLKKELGIGKGLFTPYAISCDQHGNT
jgi:hypothetical protein